MPNTFPADEVIVLKKVKALMEFALWWGETGVPCYYIIVQRQKCHGGK